MDSVQRVKTIRKALIDIDLTQADIARKVGVTRHMVNHVIKGIRNSKDIQNTIAEAIGKEVTELWPSGEAPAGIKQEAA